MSLQFARAEELSIEELIQRNVVDACDKLNKPKTTCQVHKELKPKKSAVVETAAAEAPIEETLQAKNLNRCDSSRADIPAQTEMTSYSEKKFPVSRLTESDVQDVFKYVNKQKSRYLIKDGWAATGVCAARSHLIADDIAKDCKVESGKVFVSPSRSAATLWMFKNSLWVEAKGRKFRWDEFHVANVVYVEKNGQAEPYVIDPILFDKAVPLNQWEALVKSQDPSASSWVTSSRAFGQSDRHEDDPNGFMNTQRAHEAIEKAQRDERLMRKPRP
ncbi:hypothetical protein AZI86_01315 [Bdellovibrio bacteriovorus]|uniref:Protein glutaminase domain-containing protein n=1 Tax=Bdellovibrio bacteriovorus TaxID=959 RepID=A0A150WML7_BDEBC|nr:protein-glutamine glutaminase family protein [Bdellovibrio bacteriovorus]KYG65743.1 hypothetical protein AZI86_01315 [Bdellovibrio bacteriovorus]